MSVRNAKSTDWNWENFRPEWANEGIERINAELDKWGDKLQHRSEKFRKESRKRIEKGVTQVQEELRKLPAIQRAEALRQDLEARVQVGPFRNREEAEAARKKLIELGIKPGTLMPVRK